MKLISILLLLLSSAVAQDQPFAFSQVADTWQGRNVAPKEILAYVVEFKSPYAIFAHDYYFKPEGIAPGAVATFDLKASKPGHVLWAQFVDGTEWGNHNVGLSNLLRLRPGLLRWLSEMINAYSHGREKEFSVYLASNKETDFFVKYVWIMQQQNGTEGAIGRLRIRLASAAKHDKMLGDSNKQIEAAGQEGKLRHPINRHLSTDFLGWSNEI